MHECCRSNQRSFVRQRGGNNPNISHVAERRVFIDPGADVVEQVRRNPRKSTADCDHVKLDK